MAIHLFGPILQEPFVVASLLCSLLFSLLPIRICICICVYVYMYMYMYNYSTVCNKRKDTQMPNWLNKKYNSCYYGLRELLLLIWINP